MISKLKNVIIFLLIGGALTAMYLLFIKGDKDESALVGSTSSGSATAVLPGEDSQIAKELLSILLNVKSIRLEDSIFRDEAFASLRDGTILLVPDGNEGRPNPFAPIGTDLSASPLLSRPDTPIEEITPPATPTPSVTPPATGTPAGGATPKTP